GGLVDRAIKETDRPTVATGHRLRGRLTVTMSRCFETDHLGANRSKCRLLATSPSHLRVCSPLSVIDSTAQTERRYVFRLSFIKSRKQCELIDEKRYTLRIRPSPGITKVEISLQRPHCLAHDTPM
ncbi:hypothetical protein LSAT2_016007, partial [Lamellibrachia satsuma]